MGVDDRTGVRQISMAQEESLQCERAHPTLWEWSQNMHAIARCYLDELEIHIVCKSHEKTGCFCLNIYWQTSINRRFLKRPLQVQTGRLPSFPSSPCINSQSQTVSANIDTDTLALFIPLTGTGNIAVTEQLTLFFVSPPRPYYSYCWCNNPDI